MQKQRRLASRGDELGCHSYSHYYDLTRRAFSEMERRVTRGLAALRDKAGRRDRLSRARLRGERHAAQPAARAGPRVRQLDFSVPSYYAIKAAALAKLSRKAGPRRHSRRAGHAPSPDRPLPRRPSVLVSRHGDWEVPIQVTRRARLPFIGTALTLAGAMGRACSREACSVSRSSTRASRIDASTSTTIWRPSPNFSAICAFPGPKARRYRRRRRRAARPRLRVRAPGRARARAKAAA